MDEGAGDYVKITLEREHHPTMRMDYYDFVSETWIEKTDGGSLASQQTLIRGNAHSSSLGTGDPDVWTTATHIGGDVFAPTAAGELDLKILADVFQGGVHYGADEFVVFVGPNYKHNDLTGSTMPASGGGGGVFAPYGGARKRDVERVAKRLKELEERTETITREIATKETLVVERMTETEGKQYVAITSEQAAIRREIELLTALVLANA